jgi:predicted Zn-dependent protease
VIRAYRIERTFWIIRILAVSIALFGVVGYSGLFLIKKTGALLPCITDRIPIEIEDSIGEGIVREMEPQIIHDPILDVTIEPLLKSLIAANGLDPSIRYHIIGNTEVNAYAIPGRRILLNTGLLALCDTPDQIAGIIAHEAAHIQKKHILRQIISSAGLLITAQILLSSGELANILLESGSELLRMKFSRDFEREADMTGVDYLKRASIPVAGFYRIMKKIGEASEGGDIPVILNTHPDTDERLAEIKKYAGGGRDSYKKIDRSFYIFKKKIDEYNSIRTEQSAD